MLADAASFTVTLVGGIVGALTLLDWSLTDRQKKTVKNFAEGAWIWLDDQKSESYLRIILSEKSQRIFGAVIALALLLEASVLLYMISHEKPAQQLAELLSRLPPDIAWLLAKAFFPTIWISVGGFLYITLLHPPIVKVLVRNASFWAFGLRLFVVTAASIALTWLLYQIGVDHISQATHGQGNLSWSTGLPLMALSPAYIYLLMMVAWFFWLALISLMMTLMIASGFVMLRVATYEKGPILALSAALMALGLVLKPFASD